MEDNKNNPVTEITADALNDLLREQMGDTPPSKTTKTDDKAVEEVVSEAEKIVERVEDREPDVRRSSDDRGTAPAPEGDDRLTQALTTIETLKREMEVLKTPRAESRREASIELEEVLPNVRLPKDRSKWPVKLTESDLKAVGIDPAIAPGLNILANTFYAFILDTIPALATEQTRSLIESRGATENVRRTFEDAYPDLKEHADLVEMVEHKQVWPAHKSLPRNQYMETLAKTAREKIASLKGQSYDEYMRGLQTTTGGTPRGRATSTSASSTSRGRSAPTGQQKEMMDLMDKG